ncbi:IS30 family transposase [Mycolicibacterium aichiense]|uniref:IS30 family transposase n=1 Tax=Mycolicibacterium aichiense TaxID=1799 RepID=UPI003D6723E4
MVVGFVPPLDPLAVRQISPRYLSQDERIEIADLRRAGLSMRAIADKLGRAPSTISRELCRNAAPAGRASQPFDAHRRATARRARHHRRRVDTNGHLGVLVAELLGRRWSPQQISRHLRVLFPDDRSMRLYHKSIYHAVYQPNSRFLRPTRLAPHLRSPLRTGREHRRAHQCQRRRRKRFQQPMLTIHDRPFPPIDRSQAGHWEGDLIIGDNHLSAIGTLVERQTRTLRLVHLPRADSDSSRAALVVRMQDLPPALLWSITWDQGTEMARHLATADKLRTRLLLRLPITVATRQQREHQRAAADYFPKGVTLTNHSPGHLMEVEYELNNRPRMVLQDRCPADLFAALLASSSQSVLRR